MICCTANTVLAKELDSRLSGRESMLVSRNRTRSEDGGFANLWRKIKVCEILRTVLLVGMSGEGNVVSPSSLLLNCTARHEAVEEGSTRLGVLQGYVSSLTPTQCHDQTEILREVRAYAFDST